jgi:hypothetical protein
MADLRALVAELGTTNGALATAAEITALVRRLESDTYRADRRDELLTIRADLERLSFVLNQLRAAVTQRVAELEHVLARR